MKTLLVLVLLGVTPQGSAAYKADVFETYNSFNDCRIARLRYEQEARKALKELGWVAAKGKLNVKTVGAFCVNTSLMGAGL